MKVNPTKCQKITIKRKTRYYIDFNYNVNGSPIIGTHVIKDPGVILHSKLYFKEHGLFIYWLYFNLYKIIL